MNYAVTVSVPGCLMDNEPEIYTTLTEARGGAQWWADTFREDGYVVKGNKRTGYRVYRAKDSAYPCNVIEIVATDEEPEE